MKRLPHCWSTLIAALFGCAAAGAADTNLVAQTARDQASFTNVTKIVVTEQVSEDSTNCMVINQAPEISRLLSHIHLRSKEPCACAHSLHALFKTTSGQVHVSFCDHCFDVLQPYAEDETRYYAMPKELWLELRLQHSEQGGDKIDAWTIRRR